MPTPPYLLLARSRDCAAQGVQPKCFFCCAHSWACWGLPPFDSVAEPLVAWQVFQFPMPPNLIYKVVEISIYVRKLGEDAKANNVFVVKRR